jgi:16S rRNA (adenine1518-N6/adenine1519-N6)-dimethyltransferase
VRPPGRAEIAQLLEENGLRPSRALGQNFLVDPNLAERIARLARVGIGDHVVEVGAGLGSLTVALAVTGAHVLALEIDRHLMPALRSRVEPAGVDVRELDALGCDWGSLLDSKAAPDGFVLVANLPYNIATPLVAELCIGVPSIVRMLVMVQREVGERFASPPGSKAYGAVSARIAYFATARIVARVPREVFLPRPNVDSVLVEIKRRAEPPVAVSSASYAEIDRLIVAGFATRRKMLRRSLGHIIDEASFVAAGIDSTRRPEELGIVEWGRLAAAAAAPGSGPTP